MRKKSSFLILGLALLAPGLGSASDRHFTYSYESPVLNEGGRELETYTTFRFGRDHYYSALDERLEFEIGLGDGIQTSFYLNFTQEMEAQGAGNISNEFLADGISNEWKFKLMDNVADIFGMGLYIEPEIKPDELELETKVIIDKKEGPWLWTLNLTAEPEVHLVDNTSAFSLIPSAGLGLFLADRFMVGIEAQNWNFWQSQPSEVNYSTLSLGPVLSYTASNWWVTLTVLPQITDLRTGALNLTDGEVGQKWQTRIATSLAL